MEVADPAEPTLPVRHPAERGRRPIGHAPKRRAKCALRGEACDGCVGEDGDEVPACWAATASALKGAPPRAGRIDVLVQTQTNAHRTPVRSIGSPLGRGITAWSA
jgi:hypothetical protein